MTKINAEGKASDGLLMNQPNFFLSIEPFSVEKEKYVSLE
jgi:hypothetical protein